MGEPRQWTLARHSDRLGPLWMPVEGPLLEPGESVFVVEAVLTDELVLAAAQRIGRDVNGLPWSVFNDKGRARFKRQARAALLAAGFQGPGGTDGH